MEIPAVDDGVTRYLGHNSREPEAPSSLICESCGTGVPVDRAYAMPNF
ncbi:MAG: hypothetical protein QM705_12930 [Ancrocorticia sp.]